MTPDEAHAVRGELADLCRPLHRAARRAVTRAEARRISDDMLDPMFDYLFSHMRRGWTFKLFLDAYRRGDTGGWVPQAALHGRNGQVHLTKGTLTVKLLSGSLGVPAAGANRARRAFYRNDRALDIARQDTLWGALSSNLIALLAVEDSAPRITVVRPLSAVRSLNESTAIDFMLPLPQNGSALETLAFEPDDQALLIDLPQDEDEEGQDDAGTTSG